MKIHTNTASAVETAANALHDAKDAGKVAHCVELDILTSSGSRSHHSGAIVHLATYSGGKGTAHPYRTNSGVYGANGAEAGYAATYAEWGWFLAYIFEADPTAKTDRYKDAADFHRQTNGAFVVPSPVTSVGPAPSGYSSEYVTVYHADGTWKVAHRSTVPVSV